MACVKLEWSNNQDVYSIDAPLIELLERILQVAAEIEDVAKGEVSLTFVDDEQIRELNHNYRGLDHPTDVLSFALNDPLLGESENERNSIHYLLGDIIISMERVQQQANDYGHSLEREIGFLFVHGFLHLLGYHHQDEASELVMMDKQEAVLEKVGLCR